MNILICNWRDIKNSSGGGAEILTHEMAKRWVKAGHNVTQFSSAFPGSKKTEDIDGVKFIRRGKWWTVHIFGFFYYLKNKDNFDVIVDEVHWFPFLTGIYAPKKTVALVCEVASKLFFRIFPYPVALIFLGIEKIYLFLYRNVPTMVISPSTEEDLIAAGHNRSSIIVLPMGLTLPKKLKLEKKEQNPTLICVGRLNKQKGTLEVIEAFASVSKKLPKARLWLVGSIEKDFEKAIDKKIRSLSIKKAITLWGFTSEQKKFELLSRAHLLISASAQEGWGLTVPEAGIVKTPSVVYNILGFRDIIEQKKTGVLVDTNPEALATESIELLQDKKKYALMQQAVFKKAKTYSWNNTILAANKFITNYVKKK